MKNFFNTLIVFTIVVFATNVYAANAKLSCKGNACSVVRIIYLGTGKGYIVKNFSKNKSVVVGINWLAGSQCSGVQNIQIAPLQNTQRPNGAICGPSWTANYKK